MILYSENSPVKEQDRDAWLVPDLTVCTLLTEEGDPGVVVDGQLY